MLGFKYEDIIARIKEEKGLSDEEINSKIKQKLTQLSDLISKQGAAHIIANELGINLFDGSAAFKINKLTPGMRNVGIVGKVVKLYGVNEFKNEKRQGKVASVLLGDDSGVIRLVFWDEGHIKLIENGTIKEESVVKIRNCYVRENNNYKELHLSNLGQIELSDEKIEVRPFTEASASSKKEIKDLVEGDVNVGVVGTVVQVFEPKFFAVCTNCNKKVLPDGDKFRCEQHGVVTPDYGSVLNFFFDDGSGNIRCVVFRDQVCNFLGLDKSKVLEFKDNIASFDKVKNGVMGKQIKVVGRVVKNTMFDRVEMIANSVEEVKPEELIKEHDVSNPPSV